MVKVDEQIQTHTSSLPLLSKPDRMESFMRQITRNPNMSRWRYIFSFGRKNNKEYVPLKTTVVKANNKSYLLNRIESLEDRLIQLSLEIETRRASRTSASAPKLPVSSYPVFNNPKAKGKRESSSDILPVSTSCDLQNEGETLERKKKQKQKQKRKNGKKKKASWPHLKILGC